MDLLENFNDTKNAIAHTPKNKSPKIISCKDKFFNTKRAKNDIMIKLTQKIKAITFKVFRNIRFI